MGRILQTNASKSNPDKTYNIIEGADGATYCDCPGWRNRKKCKHLTAYHADNGTVAAPRALQEVKPKKTRSSFAPGWLGGRDELTEGVFASDSFQSLPWYQGCGGAVPKDGTKPLVEYQGEYFAEPKLDGIWIACFSDGEKNRLWSRTQKEKAYGLTEHPLPAGTLLIGELGYGSENASERRNGYGHDFMDVFGILVVNHRPVLHMNERCRRVELEKFYKRLSKPLRKLFRLVPQWTMGFAKAYEAQHEGLILKRDDDSPYLGNKKKPDRWVKAKKWFEEDMVIMSMTLSTAETKSAEPMAEAVQCGAYVNGELKPLVKVGTMTDHWAREFAQNFGAYQGKVMKIGHYGQFKSGSLRHPFMIDDVRDDKDAAECEFTG